MQHQKAVLRKADAAGLVGPRLSPGVVSRGAGANDTAAVIRVCVGVHGRYLLQRVPMCLSVCG